MLAIIFALGLFLDRIEIALLILPNFEPALKALDFSAYVGAPELASLRISVLIALTLQISFLTPPFGFALFFLKGAAPPGVALHDLNKGVVPIVVIQILSIALVLVQPGLATRPPVFAATPCREACFAGPDSMPINPRGLEVRS